MKSKKVNFRNNILIFLLVGDAVFAFIGLSIGYFIRFHTPLKDVGVEAGDIAYGGYLPLLIIGVILLLIVYGQLNIYNWKLILRPNRIKLNIIKGTSFWILIYLGLSLALKLEPAISRMFVFCSWFSVIACVITWKIVFIKMLGAQDR